MRLEDRLVEHPEQIVIDEPTALVTYVGYAEFGKAQDASAWIVQKITLSALSVPRTTTISWATKFHDMTNKWSDRASLTYEE